MSKANNLDWKIYESITKYIYETLGREFGVTIEGYGKDCKIIGKSGNLHQIDVLTSQSDGIHFSRTAIECKYTKSKVTKNTVMTLLGIINDTEINKGIIVSKSGFTKSAIDFAKEYNIGLVQLREIEQKDLEENPKEFEIGHLELQIKIRKTGPNILSIDIGDNRIIKVKTEFEYFNFIVIKENQSYNPLIAYMTDFRNEVNQRKVKSEIMTKHYEIPNGILLNTATNESLKLNGITFTGQLSKTDTSKNLKFTLVEQVWLIMKSIFEKRTFTFTENGLIKENKK